MESHFLHQDTFSSLVKAMDQLDFELTYATASERISIYSEKVELLEAISQKALNELFSLAELNTNHPID